MNIQFEDLAAMLIAFAVTGALGPVIIPALLRLKVGQTERKEGVAAHLEKAGTPTMGGIMILIGVLVGTVIFAGRYPAVVPVLVLTLGFGLIGFLDDYLKVVKRRSDGLFPKEKMLCQIVVTTVFLVFLWAAHPECLDIIIPFSGAVISGTPWRIFASALLYFVVIGTVNGTNFTDGVDGLSSSVTCVVAFFFYYVSAHLEGGIEPVACAMTGALMGFLLFNLHPAKVFMGDTGSLALGGFVAGCAYMLRMPIFILLIGFVYLVEVLSVMIQVTYFKKTGGKRIFKMAPIHHHFELSGWSETRVVGIFTIVTIIMCFIAAAAV